MKRGAAYRAGQAVAALLIVIVVLTLLYVAKLLIVGLLS